MPQLTDKKRKQLVYLFAGIYFCSNMSRAAFAAVMVEMILEGFGKLDIALAPACLSVTYGLGQLLNGFLGDRLQPNRLMLGGLSVSVLMMLLIPLCVSASAMAVVWAVNGFALSMIWPPMVRIMAAYLPGDAYGKGLVRISSLSSFGTVFAYLLAALLVFLQAGWRLVFFIGAALTALMCVIWGISAAGLPSLNEAEAAPPAAGRKNATGRGRINRQVLLFLLPVMAAIVFHGVLRDSVTQWMPTYLKSTFENVESFMAILSGVVLPLFGIVCYQAVMQLHQKMLRNEITCAAVFFAVGLGGLGILSLFRDSFAAAVLGLALVVGSMHGVNMMIVCVTPKRYAGTGFVSTVTGLLNSCTYLGASVSIYGIAMVADGSNWAVTVLVWIGAAVLGLLCCMIAVLSMRKLPAEAAGPAA